jgi:hypothetical protein
MRYAQDNLTGTALDIGLWRCSHAATFLNVNPAGSAVFSNKPNGINVDNYNVTQCELLWYPQPKTL